MYFNNLKRIYKDNQPHFRRGLFRIRQNVNQTMESRKTLDISVVVQKSEKLKRNLEKSPNVWENPRTSGKKSTNVQKNSYKIWNLFLMNLRKYRNLSYIWYQTRQNKRSSTAILAFGQKGRKENTVKASTRDLQEKKRKKKKESPH